MVWLTPSIRFVSLCFVVARWVGCKPWINDVSYCSSFVAYIQVKNSSSRIVCICRTFLSLHDCLPIIIYVHAYNYLFFFFLCVVICSRCCRVLLHCCVPSVPYMIINTLCYCSCGYVCHSIQPLKCVFDTDLTSVPHKLRADISPSSVHPYLYTILRWCAIL